MSAHRTIHRRSDREPSERWRRMVVVVRVRCCPPCISCMMHSSKFLIASSVLALLVALLEGCDSTQFPQCGDDPATTPQAGKCPQSVFPQEDLRGREVNGTVRRGSDPAEGAIVRVDPWPELPSTKSS